LRSFSIRTAILLSAALLAACHGSRTPIDGRAPIIIISIDTLRSDHLPDRLRIRTNAESGRQIATRFRFEVG
jgi:hypothetical protein